MNWTLRMVKLEDESGIYYEVREIHYDDEGSPWGHTTATAAGRNRAGAIEYAKLLLEGANMPAIVFTDLFVNHYADSTEATEVCGVRMQ